MRTPYSIPLCRRCRWYCPKFEGTVQSPKASCFMHGWTAFFSPFRLPPSPPFTYLPPKLLYAPSIHTFRRLKKHDRLTRDRSQVLQDIFALILEWNFGPFAGNGWDFGFRALWAGLFRLRSVRRGGNSTKCGSSHVRSCLCVRAHAWMYVLRAPSPAETFGGGIAGSTPDAAAGLGGGHRGTCAQQVKQVRQWPQDENPLRPSCVHLVWEGPLVSSCFSHPSPHPMSSEDRRSPFSVSVQLPLIAEKPMPPQTGPLRPPPQPRVCIHLTPRPSQSCLYLD